MMAERREQGRCATKMATAMATTMQEEEEGASWQRGRDRGGGDTGHPPAALSPVAGGCGCWRCGGGVLGGGSGGDGGGCGDSGVDGGGNSGSGRWRQ